MVRLRYMERKNNLTYRFTKSEIIQTFFFSDRKYQKCTIRAPTRCLHILVEVDIRNTFIENSRYALFFITTLLHYYTVIFVFIVTIFHNHIASLLHSYRRIHTYDRLLKTLQQRMVILLIT